MRSVILRLLNDGRFKSFPHADIEVKLLLSLLYYLEDDLFLSDRSLKTVLRKTKKIDKENYNNVKLFVELLKRLIKNNKPDKITLIQLRDDFLRCNNGRYAILQFLKLDDPLIDRLFSLYEEQRD